MSFNSRLPKFNALGSQFQQLAREYHSGLILCTSLSVLMLHNARIWAVRSSSSMTHYMVGVVLFPNSNTRIILHTMTRILALSYSVW